MAWIFLLIVDLFVSLISYGVCYWCWYTPALSSFLACMLLLQVSLQYMFCVVLRTLWSESAGSFCRLCCHCPSILLLWHSLLLLPSLCPHVCWWVGWTFCGWHVLCLWNVCCRWILCGTFVFGSFQVMLLNTIHQLYGMPMCLFCLLLMYLYWYVHQC